MCVTHSTESKTDDQSPARPTSSLVYNVQRVCALYVLWKRARANVHCRQCSQSAIRDSNVCRLPLWHTDRQPILSLYRARKQMLKTHGGVRCTRARVPYLLSPSFASSIALVAVARKGSEKVGGGAQPKRSVTRAVIAPSVPRPLPSVPQCPPGVCWWCCCSGVLRHSETPKRVRAP